MDNTEGGRGEEEPEVKGFEEGREVEADVGGFVVEDLSKINKIYN